MCWLGMFIIFGLSSKDIDGGDELAFFIKKVS
jgi:hypothetical protein